jgi:zinc transporter ZupT
MFPNTFTAVIVASVLACLVTTIGIFVISKYEKWGNKNAVYVISFAAGVLISVSFIHIIPESFSMNKAAPTYLLAGFLTIFVFNRFLSVFICHKHGDTDLPAGITPMIGIGLHSFIDGIIYSVTFNVSIFTGGLASIGMVLHEFPEGIVTFLLLKRVGFPPTRSALYAFLAAAISTPLGTLLSFPFISKIDRPGLGILLAISAGALVYVGASHLLPAVEKENKRYTLLAIGLGVLAAVLIVLAKRK